MSLEQAVDYALAAGPAGLEEAKPAGKAHRVSSAPLRTSDRRCGDRLAVSAAGA